MKPNSTLNGFVRGLFEGQIRSSSLFPFPGPDPETEETSNEIASMVSEWARESIDPEAIDLDKEIPGTVLEGMAELGLFGLTVPEAYGGAGMGQYTYSRVMEAVAHRCASTVTVLGGHLGIGLKALLLYGTEEQRQRWLPRMASGEWIGAFALTEAGAGSDAGALRTAAERQPDGSWKLNGRKVWITNGGFAGFFAVFARTPHPERSDAPIEERPISCFLVPRETAGVTVGLPEDKMGLRGSCTTEVGLEDVVLPEDYLIGPQGEGFKVAMNVLNSGRHGLAACCLGQGRLALGLALQHAREREQFGQPIANFGMIQELLAGMEADLYSIESGTWLAAGLIDRGAGDTMLEAACCKMFATEKLWRIANDALQVTGGTGFMREYPYERIVRDARINMIFEGTNQVLRMMLATQGLRRPLRGEATITQGAGRLEGVAEELAAEGAVFEQLAARFAASSQEALDEHGPGLRAAQLPVRRIADMAVALFSMGAVLSRASGPEATRGASTPVARLACARLAQDFRQAQSEEKFAHDELIREVARGL